MNSMMQDLLPNVPLKNSEKHLANHFARKTVAIKIKQQQVRKSERTTGQNRKADLNAYTIAVKRCRKNNHPNLLAIIIRQHPKTNILSLQMTQIIWNPD